MKILSLLLRRLHFFRRDAISVGVGIVPNARDLPGDFDMRFIRANHETIARDLLGNYGLGELADHCQLIAKVAVESFEVVGQDYGRHTALIGPDVAVVDVHHVRRFNERVR